MTNSPPRGPSGVALPPRPWLASTPLPLDIIAAGTPLHRIHRTDHAPIFFGPGDGQPPTYRFDSASSTFGVLYLGLSFKVALVETVLRNPARKMVDFHEIASRAATEIQCRRDLRLVKLFGDGLPKIGCDNSISTGPYDVCGEWADAMWSHSDRPDGLAYQSRHDSSEICLALFERPDIDLLSAQPIPLVQQLSQIARVLSNYGKSITNIPL